MVRNKLPPVLCKNTHMPRPSPCYHLALSASDFNALEKQPNGGRTQRFSSPRCMNSQQDFPGSTPSISCTPSLPISQSSRTLRTLLIMCLMSLAVIPGKLLSSSLAAVLMPASVATAIADVFRKNGINVGRKFAKIMKILDKIDDVKSRGVI